MANGLDKDTLIDDLTAMFGKGGNTKESVSKDLADAIEKYVKSAKVSVTAPTGAIQVQGSPSAQSNVAPIIIDGELS